MLIEYSFSTPHLVYQINNQKSEHLKGFTTIHHILRATALVNAVALNHYHLPLLNEDGTVSQVKNLF